MIKEHLYLHIGTHKTGSTSIQHCLKENQSLLQSHGYYYPMEGSYFYPPEASPSLLAHALLGKRPSYIINKNIDEESCVSDILRDIKQSKCEKVIISSEHFSHARTIEEVKKIAGVFFGLFKKITVIVYLRRQDTRLESFWSQRVKIGLTTKSFDEYFSRHFDWNYFEMLNLWTEVFGKKNLVVRPFEKGQFFKNDLVQDFLQILGCTTNIQDTRLKNQSPPVEYLEALRIFWGTIPNHAERRPLLKILRSLPIKIDATEYTLFTSENRKMFLNLYRESNRLVAQEYLGRSDGLLFYESESIDLPTYPGMSLERFSEISRQFIMSLAGINSQLTEKLGKQS
jgi:hypothetical protein